ncbi:MarR family winged helix-turn-helix transcriptional regulator [Humibacter antri]
MSVDDVASIEYESMVFSRHLAALSGRARRKSGVLDQSAYTLLSLLQAGGPASIGELGAITGLDASTLNRQTAALLRDGFAERIPNPDGGTARKFRVSGAGEHALNEEREASRTAVAQITAAWSEGDRAAFAKLLGLFNIGTEMRTGRVWPRP